MLVLIEHEAKRVAQHRRVGSAGQVASQRRKCDAERLKQRDAQLPGPLAAIAPAVSSLDPRKESAPHEPAAQLSARACARRADRARASPGRAVDLDPHADFLKQLALAMPTESRAMHPDEVRAFGLRVAIVTACLMCGNSR